MTLKKGDCIRIEGYDIDLTVTRAPKDQNNPREIIELRGDSKGWVIKAELGHLMNGRIKFEMCN